MGKKRMIIVSFDAMGARDMPYMKSLENFGKFMKKAAICTNVSSVYPSLTYPAHTSIVTGKKPYRHGIINNMLLQPERENPDWYWQRQFIKGTTLYDEAIKAGFKTAGLLWPVTAKSKIHYNIPEVLANRPWENQMIVSAMNSTFWYALKMNHMFGHLRDGIRQPALDNFTHASALYTIEHYNPDLFLIHYTDLDTNRHIYGVEHEKATEAMKRHDIRLGELLEALQKTGDMEETTVVLLGDHCQFNAEHIVYPNYLLKEAGFIRMENGKVMDYNAAAKTCDGSCYIYMHPRDVRETKMMAKLSKLVHSWVERPECGIERVFNAKEAKELGADDTCLLMIEAKEGYYFLDDMEILTRKVEDAKAHKMRAVHGYLPEKENYKTFFMADGYGIREHARIEAMHLYDEGPTLAKIMGLHLPDADGRILEEILL